MDRFIALRCLLNLLELIYLKSNMDRFIEGKTIINPICDWDLKSNMDRFIDFVIYLAQASELI